MNLIIKVGTKTKYYLTMKNMDKVSKFTMSQAWTESQALRTQEERADKERLWPHCCRKDVWWQL